MKILITGVAGLIGSNLSDYIIQNNPDCYIIGIDNLLGGNKNFVNPKVDMYPFDLTKNHIEIEKIFEKNKIDYVFHLSAFAAEGLSPFIRCFNYKHNLIATAFIINMSIKYKIKKLIFTSSMAVYGDQTPPFTENMIPRPVDPYGIAKYACEMDLEVASKQHGLNYTIIRPHNVYGIKQNIWDPYRNVIAIWMLKIINNQPITIYGDGEQIRSFSYIEDFIPALWKSIELKKSGDIINLGSTKHHTINQVADILEKIVIKSGFVDKIERIYLEKRDEVKKAYSSYQKSIDLLDYHDNTNLEDGIYKMWKWVLEITKNNQYNNKKYRINYELNDKIYSYWKTNSH